MERNGITYWDRLTLIYGISESQESPNEMGHAKLYRDELLWLRVPKRQDLFLHTNSITAFYYRRGFWNVNSTLIGLEGRRFTCAPHNLTVSYDDYYCSFHTWNYRNRYWLIPDITKNGGINNIYDFTWKFNIFLIFSQNLGLNGKFIIQWIFNIELIFLFPTAIIFYFSILDNKDDHWCFHWDFH